MAASYLIAQLTFLSQGTFPLGEFTSEKRAQILSQIESGDGRAISAMACCSEAELLAAMPLVHRAGQGTTSMLPH